MGEIKEWSAGIKERSAEIRKRPAGIKEWSAGIKKRLSEIEDCGSGISDWGGAIVIRYPVGV